MLWLILIGIGIILAALGIVLICFVHAASESLLLGLSSLHFLGIGFGLIALSFFLGIIFSVGNAFDYEFSNEPTLKETTEITSLDDKYSIKGNFFLGSGTVSSVEYYYFIKDTDKGKITDKIPQKEAYITEDNSQKPRIEEYAYKGERNATKDYWLSMNFGQNKEDFSYKTAYYRVFIPENTIKTDFSVDLN